MRPQSTSPKFLIPGKQLRYPTRKSSEWTDTIWTLPGAFLLWRHVSLPIEKHKDAQKNTLSGRWTFLKLGPTKSHIIPQLVSDQLWWSIYAITFTFIPVYRSSLRVWVALCPGLYYILPLNLYSKNRIPWYNSRHHFFMKNCFHREHFQI